MNGARAVIGSNTKRDASPSHGIPKSPLREILHRAVPVLLIVGVMAAFVGSMTLEKAERSPSTVQLKPSEITVRMPLPPNTTEEDIPKWVPVRLPSGRTELVPWSSVDADIARNPDSLANVLDQPDPEPRPTLAADKAKLEESPALGQQEPDSEPKAGRPVESGFFTTLRARLLRVEARSDTPGNANKVPQHVEGSGEEAKGAPLAVNPSHRDLDNKSAPPTSNR